MIETNLIKTDRGGGDVELSDPSKLPTEPLVSVWMLTYNQVHYIREALDSVLMQQVDFPYEICLGEDGSTDGTREICLEYVNKHPDKIRLFLRDRSNPARNKYIVPYRHNTVETWNACPGKYIALLEGDDYWVSIRKLEYQAKLLEASPAVTIDGHFVLRMCDGRPWEGAVFPGGNAGLLTLERFLREPFYVHTSSLMLRQGKPMPWEAFTQASVGDTLLLFWHLLQGDFLLSPVIMSVHRMNEGGVWAFQSTLKKTRAFVALWKLLGPLVPVNLQDAHKLSYAALLNTMIAELSKAHLLREAMHCFRETVAMILRFRSLGMLAKIRLLLGAVEALVLPSFRQARIRVTARLRARLVRRERPSTKLHQRPLG